MAKEANNTENTPFAVIANGGKQYIVRPGTMLTLEKMDGEFTAGQAHVFDQVLLTDDGSKTVVGTPTVAGAKVTAEFIEAGRAKKLILFVTVLNLVTARKTATDSHLCASRLLRYKTYKKSLLGFLFYYILFVIISP
jgi:large subunit ribosomal protein L21